MTGHIMNFVFILVYQVLESIYPACFYCLDKKKVLLQIYHRLPPKQGLINNVYLTNIFISPYWLLKEIFCPPLPFLAEPSCLLFLSLVVSPTALSAEILL